MSRVYYLTLKTTNFFALKLLNLMYRFQPKKQNSSKYNLAYPFLYWLIQVISVFMKGPRTAVKFLLAGKLLLICFLPIISLAAKVTPKKFLLFLSLFLYSNQIFKSLRIKLIADPKLAQLIKRSIERAPLNNSKIYRFSVIVPQFEIDSKTTGLAENFILNIDTGSQFDKQKIVKVNSIISNVFHSEGFFESAGAIERLCKEILDKEINRTPGNYFESNYATAVGHISLIDIIIKGRHLNLLSSEAFNIVIDQNKIANSLYFNILKKEAIKCGVTFLTDCDNKLLEPDMEMLLDNNGRYINARKFYGVVEYRWWNEFGKPLISFDESHSNLIRVEKLLKKMGVDTSKPLVGFHIRTNNDFLKSGRGSKLSSVYLSLNYLSKLGLNVIRVGTEKVSIGNKIPSNNYFDLCDWGLSKDEFELICLYVWSKSIFFIGNLSGGTMPPNTFGTPTFWFDVFPLAHVRLPGTKDYFIPKKVYSYHSERELTFSEMFIYPESQSENPFSLRESGYRLIESSGIDVLNGVKSMVDRYLYKNQKVSYNCKVDEYEMIYKNNGFLYGAKIDLDFLSHYTI